MSSFFERLKKERNRLELNQEEFGKIGGVKKRAQINYEKGERRPDSAYLEALAKIGVDVMYLLTGIRFNGSLTSTPDETILLNNYRNISEEEKNAVNVMSIGERLKEERKRFGYNQTTFATLAGVQISAQTNYENNKRTPDASYLAAIAKIGADVLYVVTGERQMSALTPDETILLDNYRNISEEGKDAVKRTALALANPKSKKRA